jgi:epoxyqueuosine reductase QueG
VSERQDEASTPTAAEIQTLARRRGLDRVGVARPRGEHAPPWARSVLVLGLATPDDAFDYITHLEFADGSRRWHKPAYEALTARAALLALDIISQGIRCLPVTFADSARLIDLRAAAVEAGLAVLGLNGLVLDREFGPRIKWTAVFVEPELPVGCPINDYYCNCCTLCWTRCPTGALGPTGLDRSRCIAEFAPSNNMMALQRKMRVEVTPLTRLQCNRCITACPVGKGKVTTYYDEG